MKTRIYIINAAICCMFVAPGCSDNHRDTVAQFAASEDGGLADAEAKNGNAGEPEDADNDSPDANSNSASDNDSDSGKADSGETGQSVSDNNASSTESEVPTTCEKFKCNGYATCDDSDGHPKCSCIPGFQGDGNAGKTCWDIDECEKPELSNCAKDADCENTEGSFFCTCNKGFVGDGTSCEDVDECKEPRLNGCDTNASCENRPGSYTCRCKDGFVGDGKSCIDVNECDGETNTCHPDAACVNTAPGFHCECKAGYSGDGFSCEDVDECADPALFTCSPNATCKNSRGSYGCVCNQGYNGDGKSCTNANECLGILTSAVCDPDADCTDVDGSYTCKCKDGFVGGGYATDDQEKKRIAGCEDVDECVKGTFSCPTNTYCVNTRGGYRCDCSKGYTYDGKSCTDINECSLTGTDAVCHGDADCTNTNGSYTCKCKAGFSGGGYATGDKAGCADIDECANKTASCPANTYCVNTRASYRCDCSKGYTYDGKSCTDINECSLTGTDAVCHGDADCTNTNGSYTCKCKAGFSGGGYATGTNAGCAEIDECATGTYSCPTNTHCVNARGGSPGYTCPCDAGLGLDKSGKCVPLCDIALADTAKCGANARCHVDSTSGQAVCTDCKEGYTGDGKTCVQYCRDINGNYLCGPNTSCAVTANGQSANCACLAGYEGTANSATGCTDINECTKGTHTCACSSADNCTDASKLTYCANTAGSFTCECKSGYQKDQSGKCVNINECTAGTAGCDTNATCTDQTPGFACTCKTGYSGSGKSCTDVNECTAGTDTCNRTTQDCVNTTGSFSCNCKSGYQKDQSGACVDINECTAGTAGCDANATCANQTPGFTCTCKTGYSGSGKTCTDVNECTAGTDSCNRTTQDCVNTTGSFTCNCKSGYQKDQSGACVDINECTAGTHNCDTNATCTNKTPGFTCACKSGYSGSGTSCTDVNECTAGTDSCNRTTQDCANTTGSFTCNCKSGYQKDQSGACVNINECAANTHNCDPNATCTDKTPGFSCACKSGYSGSGTSCADVNECSGNTHNCNVQISTCENTQGGFNCKNINECQSGASKTHDCNKYATCQDINCETNNSCTNQSATGFSCGCKAGFAGSGHGTSGCYCDLSGYWAMREIGDSAKQVNGSITLDAFQYHVYELDKYEYDGQKIVLYRKGCGQDLWPELHANVGGLLNEIYSTYVPIDAYDQTSLIRGADVNQANITPDTKSFTTSTEAAVTGLTLNDPLNDPWPTDHSKINWVDSDGDGEIGYTVRSAGTTKATRTHPDMTFSYLPTSTSYPVNKRAACWSGAARIKAHFTVDSVATSCSVLTGKMIMESSEGHFRTCTTVPQAQWDNTDIACDKAYWASSPPRCTSDESASFDTEAHAPDTSYVTITYKMVKVGKLTDTEPTCSFVRSYNFDQ
jgi:hypothetical protein